MISYQYYLVGRIAACEPKYRLLQLTQYGLPRILQKVTLKMGTMFYILNTIIYRKHNRQNGGKCC